MHVRPTVTKSSMLHKNYFTIFHIMIDLLCLTPYKNILDELKNYQEQQLWY